MFPSLLVTDGSCMIDRRRGIHGHPLEIQVCSAFQQCWLCRNSAFLALVVPQWWILAYITMAVTLACIKMGRPELAERAISLTEKRLSNDKWPGYCDTRNGRFIGKQSRLYQTWTIAGFLTFKMLLEQPEMAAILTCE